MSVTKKEWCLRGGEIISDRVDLSDGRVACPSCGMALKPRFSGAFYRWPAHKRVRVRVEPKNAPPALVDADPAIESEWERFLASKDAATIRCVFASAYEKERATFYAGYRAALRACGGGE